VTAFNIAMIGDRINPGFKSTKTLVDNDDLDGLQALAVKQVQAGASALDVTIGPRGSTDFDFLSKVVRAIQKAVTVPLCFDSPSLQVQEVCFKAYDRARSGPALVNSVTEQRWELMDLYRRFGPFKVIVMASERMEDGIAKQNKSANEIASTAKRVALRLQAEYGLTRRHLYRRLGQRRSCGHQGIAPRNARRNQRAAQRRGTQRAAHYGRTYKYRPAVAAQGGRWLRSEACT